MTWPANKILRTLHDLGEPVPAQRISEETGYSVEQVWDACNTLVRNKLAVRAERGVYHITAAGSAAIVDGKEVLSGPKAPTGPRVIRGTFRERLWKAMRRQRKGTVGNFLSLILQDGENETAVTLNARKYICMLCLGGYLIRLPGKQQGTALTSSGYTRYLLVIDNGPLAPVIRKGERQIYDPNTGASVELKGEVGQ